MSAEPFVDPELEAEDPDYFDHVCVRDQLVWWYRAQVVGGDPESALYDQVEELLRDCIDIGKLKRILAAGEYKLVGGMDPELVAEIRRREG